MDNCSNCNKRSCLCGSQIGPFTAVDLCGISGGIPPVIPTACSGLCEYGYIYNLGPETVAVEADIIFDSTGIVTPGITHAPGTSQIFVTRPGIYEVTFIVSNKACSLFLSSSEMPSRIKYSCNACLIVCKFLYDNFGNEPPNFAPPFRHKLSKEKTKQLRSQYRTILAAIPY